jgi:DNA helicase-2/ATP-dependent DNA helicase PcrA
MSSYEKHLNPIFRNLSQIADFGDMVATYNLESEEFPPFMHLENLSIKALNIQKQRMDALEVEIEDQIQIIDDQTGDDKSSAVGVYNQLLKRLKLVISRMNRELEVVDNPYFGRITIQRDALGKLKESEITTYIGKFAYFDEDSKKVLVTDWRAPIANLYYVNSGPTKGVSFKTPLGEFKGDLKIKRQFDIANGRIKSIYDAKSGNVSADEFLLTQLNRRLGKKLADIVATIQGQQNDIIRADINTPIILQGVAGSGKTTIVLHRLAYLFFTHPDEIRPEKSLIVAPNRMFLDYISDVLPSLGIVGVESNTFLFWAKKILGMDDKYTLYNGEYNLEYKKFKGSGEFLNKIEGFFEVFEDKLLEDLPFSEYQNVREKYYELKKNNPEISVVERIDLALNATYVTNMLKSRINPNIKPVSDATKEKIETFVKSKLDTKKIYREFIESLNDRGLSEYTRKTFSKHTFMQEDLSPMLWIHFMLNGTSEYMKEYIVVDEAQDMSPFELYLLSIVSKKNNLFLAGDIAQSIIPPFQIPNWNIVMNIIEERRNTKFKYFQLNKCYRTTVEIIEYSNNILKNYFPKDFQLPEAVLRHGQEVTTLNNDSNLVELINEQFEKGSATVAIITKDDSEAILVYDKLEKKKEKLTRPLTTFSDSDYKTGILVLPVSKAKGLEFDSVFISNYKSFNFNIDHDSRLFYVAVTRALHRLYIIDNE